MQLFFYQVFLWLLRAGTAVTSLYNKKNAKIFKGWQGLLKKIEAAIKPGEKIIWIHCASLGEFEQGRPVIEKLYALQKGHKILITFFSSSGYEVQKNYPLAEWVFYLPPDGYRNAKKFVETVNPSLVIFVKYEFWYYYLKEVSKRSIPLLLISAYFRKNMLFFKWYGKLYRNLLAEFDHLFVQNKESKQLLDNIGLSHKCSISGDTRFDRVIEIAEKGDDIPYIKEFIGEKKAIIAGSTWPEDEEVLQKTFFRLHNMDLKLIIAPHEISNKHINDIKKIFPGCALYSKIDDASSSFQSARVLIIDSIGLLSRLYKYAFVAYVGGGLRPSGIHNVLEAAVYNKVVFFGPYFQKFAEAAGLVYSGGGISFFDEKKNGEMLCQLIEALLIDKEDYLKRSKAAGDFVSSGKGATDKIVEYIQENRLLTN